MKIGSLDCLKREAQADEVVGDVVLLHGFGADASDLFPLADLLDEEGRWNFYFPEAPVEVPIGGGFMGRGWFPISVRDLESGVDFTQVRPPGLDSSAAAVGDLIFELNSPRLVLGGFSQGAMIAMEVALNHDVAGLVLWSGSMLDEAGWRKKAGALRGKRYVQSHGMRDSVLPFQVGMKLQEMLKSAGAVGEFVGFPGAHEIPGPVIRKTQELLRELTK